MFSKCMCLMYLKIKHIDTLHTKKKEREKEEIPSLVGIRVVFSLYLLDTYKTKHRPSTHLSILFIPNF